MPLKMFQPNNSLKIPKIKNTIGIAAGKGGVGKSSVTINLALALRHMGFTVGVLDADIYGPSVRKMLPEDRLPSQRDQVIIPAICFGIKMISMAYFRKENEASVVRAPIANGVISQFIKQVEWGDLDYLLIDFPPGTGDIQLTLSQQANLSGAIMVTTPQEISLMDVRKAINMFDHVKVPIIGIVENMSYYHHKKTNELIYIFGKGGGERLSREIGVPFIGDIPIDPDLCQRADNGQSIFVDNGFTSPSAPYFLTIAENLIQHLQTLNNASQQSLTSFELNWREIP